MKFKKIYIEITNSCNLSCHFCIQNKRKAKMMNLDEFKHIIHEIKPYTKYVYLHVLGEPLLHPLLADFLQVCKENDIKVNITTNGTLLKKQLHTLIDGMVRQVNVSLHNFEEHKDINQLEYLNEICECASVLASHNTYVSLRLWNMKNSKIDEATYRIYEYVLHYFDITHDEENIKKHHSIKCRDHIFLQFEEQFAWPNMCVDTISEQGTCLGAKSMLGILSDGSVVPCCLDSKGDITLGNIYTNSLKEILYSSRYKEMVKGFQKYELNEELCQKCGYRSRFDK